MALEWIFLSQHVLGELGDATATMARWLWQSRAAQARRLFW